MKADLEIKLSKELSRVLAQIRGPVVVCFLGDCKYNSGKQECASSEIWIGENPDSNVIAPEDCWKLKNKCRNYTKVSPAKNNEEDNFNDVPPSELDKVL